MGQMPPAALPPFWLPRCNDQLITAFWINWLITRYWLPTANWCSIWWAPTLWSSRSIRVSWCAARLNVKSGSRFGNPAASQRQSRGSKIYKSIKQALGWAWIRCLSWLANDGSISRLKERVVTGIRIRSYIKWPPKMGKQSWMNYWCGKIIGALSF